MAPKKRLARFYNMEAKGAQPQGGPLRQHLHGQEDVMAMDLAGLGENRKTIYHPDIHGRRHEERTAGIRGLVNLRPVVGARQNGGQCSLAIRTGGLL